MWWRSEYDVAPKHDRARESADVHQKVANAFERVHKKSELMCPDIEAELESEGNA